MREMQVTCHSQSQEPSICNDDIYSASISFKWGMRQLIKIAVTEEAARWLQQEQSLWACPWNTAQPVNHHHPSLNCEGRWGTTDDFTTSFLHCSLFSTALWDLPNSRPVHSLMLSSHLFLCLPCRLPPFTVPCKMVLARPVEQKTWPDHCSLRLFTIVRRSSCGPIACWILARTSSLVTWSFYKMRSILR